MEGEGVLSVAYYGQKLWPYLTLVVIGILTVICVLGYNKLESQDQQIKTLQVQLSDQQIRMHRIVDLQTGTSEVIDGIIRNQKSIVKLLKLQGA